MARMTAGDGSPTTVNRFQASYVVGCGLQLPSFMADSFEAEYLRETAERHCSMSNLYVLNKAPSLDPEGRS